MRTLDSSTTEEEIELLETWFNKEQEDNLETTDVSKLKYVHSIYYELAKTKDPDEPVRGNEIEQVLKKRAKDYAPTLIASLFSFAKFMPSDPSLLDDLGFYMANCVDAKKVSLRVPTSRT